MANALTLNPYKIDTAMGASMKASSGLPQNIPIHVTEIYWLNPVTPGDTFTVTDATGTAIKQGRCEISNESQLFRFVPPRVISDFTVGTLSSGTLFITYY